MHRMRRLGQLLLSAVAVGLLRIDDDDDETIIQKVSVVVLKISQTIKQTKITHTNTATTNNKQRRLSEQPKIHIAAEWSYNMVSTSSNHGITEFCCYIRNNDKHNTEKNNQNNDE